MVEVNVEMKEEILPHWTVRLEDLRKVETTSEDKERESFRPIGTSSAFKCRVFDESRGSAYVEMGSTKVLVEIDGPRESPSAGSQSGIIKVHLESEDLRIRAELESALSSLVHLDKYPRSEFNVNVSLLSCDGGELCASILASSLSFVDAHVEMVDVAVAAHVARLTDGSYVVDPPIPLPPGSSSITVAFMPNLNQLICTDIRGALSVREAREAMAYANKQALRLYPLLRKAIHSSIAPLPVE